LSIALDAMGGDHAPEAIVDGAMQAASQLTTKLYLVGDEARIKPLLPNVVPKNVELVHASETVDMADKPLDAYRKKKDSSLMVACRLVKDGKAEAMISAGNTGAATATALLQWRQIEGIHRPAIASPLPSKFDGFTILDSGASPDVDPIHLVEFAVMGRAYAQRLMGRPNPKVHLLNIGEEEGKGNAFAREVFQLLSRYPWFEGNIEGKTMFAQETDVVVCDAFVGNIVLKTSEGLAELIVDTVRSQIPTNPIAKALYWPVKKVMMPLRKSMDYSSIGASPLLGLNGLCMISHGRSNARAIKNALLLTERAVRGELVDTIRKAVMTELRGPA
jgi:phosphate acyltransferase